MGYSPWGRRVRHDWLTNTLILPCAKWITSGKQQYCTRNSAWCSLITLKNRLGEGEGGSTRAEYMHTYNWLPFGAGGKKTKTKTNKKKPSCQGRRCKRCRFDPWVVKISWRRHGNPRQYSFLENPMDRGPWLVTVHRVEKSWTQPKRFSTHARNILKQLSSN